MLIKIIRVFCIPYFTSLGVVIGGTIIGSLSSIFIFESPVKIINSILKDIRLWGILVGLGGSFTTIRGLEIGLSGEFTQLAKQGLILLGAFLGSFTGFKIISFLIGEIK
ncbi:YtrH family sporulation protein [Thermoanaerobacterium sp. RBIITD]|uniref:YtrH family sporulation protein n=1 Tax=Thermoanaerobacterium sp. RBIITD TaxID=1550240 RepID=UPI000BB77475|nr:YtrH family sporulation protein [Thermoanaerobacterium sp. RBIITD]SNX54746.1 Sporulation protein YtrH [Thermoanaerobacterium sp. RBIITD]